MIKTAIAEDDFRVALIHEEFLKKVEGVCMVGKASNASETMALLKGEEIDLLLLDIYMPDHMGTDLLPEIRQKFPAVDIVMITASTEKKWLEMSVRNGVFHYIIKPATLEQFQSVIENYKKQKALLERHEEISQTLVDHYLGTKTAVQSPDDLPKGIDKITLDKIRQNVEQSDSGFTAEELAEKLGISRTTARRYLEYLISVKQVKAELEYGIVGRPVRKYIKFG